MLEGPPLRPIKIPAYRAFALRGFRDARGSDRTAPVRHGRVRAALRVQFPDRTGLTAGLRYRFNGPVRPVTGRNRSNVNLNSNFTVVAVPTGIPAGYTGIPAGLAGIPAGFVLRLPAVYRPVTPVYRPVWPVYRLFRVFFRRLKN